MARIDLGLPDLWAYRPELPEPADLDDFWARTIREHAELPLDAEFAAVDNGLATVESFDVTYSGFGGERVKAWLHLPAAPLRSGPLPGVVQYQGYNGGRGLALEHVFWATAGFAHLVMDTRGQGSGWTSGETPDPHGTGPSQPGFLTRGIESPETHFYRRVFVDAMGAVAALRSHPAVDASQVAVAGHSQGGGIALATAALVPDVVAALPDVPFLCDFRRGAEVAVGDPYLEVARYLGTHRDKVEQTFATLSYFDAAILGRRAHAPALFSAAVMDTICPPSTVFAAYHAYAGPKEIEVYEFNDHEGGKAFHQRRQLDWLRAVLAE